MKPIIDYEFLNLWDPRYDDVEHDQLAYERIIEDVSHEMSSPDLLSEKTFLRIIDWKAARVKGKLSKDYASYRDRIAEAWHISEIPAKIAVLMPLRGIGVPVASTILHFLHPEIVPINDYRTVEVLHAAGLLTYLSRDERRFPDFVSAIMKIKLSYPSFSLRQIDRALFSYHKLEFEPERTGTRPRIRCRAKSADGRLR